MSKLHSRWFKGLSFVALALAAIGVLSAFSLSPASVTDSRSVTRNVNPSSSFTFSLVPSPGISSCLPNAKGKATITTGSLNDTMTVSVTGLAKSTGFDLFILELPNKPFGVAWYQSDLKTNDEGAGSATVRGIFNKETFSISLGDNSSPPIVFPATHQYHLGLWFNNPKVPFNLGCEPGQPQPIITPFNGAQHAGIQVLNTSNFPDNAGPLSHVS